MACLRSPEPAPPRRKSRRARLSGWMATTGPFASSSRPPRQPDRGPRPWKAAMPEQVAGAPARSGRTVLITGAAGGLGRAFALGFAAQGDRVVAADVNLEGAA